VYLVLDVAKPGPVRSEGERAKESFKFGRKKDHFVIAGLIGRAIFSKIGIRWFDQPFDEPESQFTLGMESKCTTVEFFALKSLQPIAHFLILFLIINSPE
jgi:hypothetical protein